MLTTADIVTGAVAMQKYGPDLATHARVQEDYRKFCRLNRLAREEGYEPCVGQMKNAGLAAGTIRDYIEIAAKGDKSTAAYVAKKAVRAMQTDSQTGHAADITLTQASEIITRAKKEAPEVAEPLWLLLATGQRRVDIHRLHPESVKMIRKKTLAVKWLWTKGIQKIQHRREVIFPINDLPDAPGTLAQTLESSVKARTKPFECTVQKLNAVMKKMGFRATTGSFRRLFSDRIEAYCKRTGIAKQAMMLHQSDSMDKAFYSFNK